MHIRRSAFVSTIFAGLALSTGLASAAQPAAPVTHPVTQTETMVPGHHPAPAAQSPDAPSIAKLSAAVLPPGVSRWFLSMCEPAQMHCVPIGPAAIGRDGEKVIVHSQAFSTTLHPVPGGFTSVLDGQMHMYSAHTTDKTFTLLPTQEADSSPFHNQWLIFTPGYQAPASVPVQ